MLHTSKCKKEVHILRELYFGHKYEKDHTVAPRKMYLPGWASEVKHHVCLTLVIFTRTCKSNLMFARHLRGKKTQ